MKFIAKIISDNGYKIELIRPLRDIPFQLGAAVEISLMPKQVDLINTFNNLLDDETKNMILDKFNEAREPLIAGPIPVAPPGSAPVVNGMDKYFIGKNKK